MVAGEHYQVQPDVYDISVGDQGEVDLRSAVERGPEWVLWAHKNGVLRGGLLIVGGGICGLSAACAARLLRVPVTLATDSLRSLGRFSGSPRWVHPRLYQDWPHAFDRKTLSQRWLPHLSHELRALRTALQWTGEGGSAHDTAELWLASLRPWLRDIDLLGGPRIHFREGERPIIPSGSGFSLQDPTDPASASKRWATILVCRGPHAERSRLPHMDGGLSTHTSTEYWDPADPLWREPMEVPDRGEIAILGCGDGGQQDLFRTLTGRDPVKVLLAMAKHAPWFEQLTVAAREALRDHKSFDHHADAIRTLLTNDHDRWLHKIAAWLREHAPPDPKVSARLRALQASPEGAVRCFALNLLLTQVCVHLVQHDQPALLRFDLDPKRMKDATPQGAGVQLTAQACLGHGHTLDIHGNECDFSRLILRIGQDDDWWAGPPRWVPPERGKLWLDRKAGSGLP